MIRTLASSLGTGENKQSASLKMKREAVWRAVWEQLQINSQLTHQQLPPRAEPAHRARASSLGSCCHLCWGLGHPQLPPPGQPLLLPEGWEKAKRANPISETWRILTISTLSRLLLKYLLSSLPDVTFICALLHTFIYLYIWIYHPPLQWIENEVHLEWFFPWDKYCLPHIPRNAL